MLWDVQNISEVMDCTEQRGGIMGDKHEVTRT